MVPHPFVACPDLAPAFSHSLAVRWTIMRVNPVMLVQEDLPVYKREEAVPLTAEQTICVLNAVEGHRLAALYHVALTLGLRLGEVLGLQWGDIDWQAQTITIQRQVQETAGHVAVRNATKTDASLRVAASSATLGAVRGALGDA